MKILGFLPTETTSVTSHHAIKNHFTGGRLDIRRPKGLYYYVGYLFVHVSYHITLTA